MYGVIIEAARAVRTEVRTGGWQRSCDDREMTTVPLAVISLSVSVQPSPWTVYNLKYRPA